MHIANSLCANLVGIEDCGIMYVPAVCCFTNCDYGSVVMDADIKRDYVHIQFTTTICSLYCAWYM